MSDAITAGDVLGWIVEANTGRARSRKVRLVESDAELLDIAELINAQRSSDRRDRSGEAAWSVIYAKLGEAKRAVRSLTDVLPAILEAYERGGVDELVREGNAVVTRKNPGWAALSRLHDASREASRILGGPRRPGRHTEPWQMWASSLIDLVRAALAKGGASRLSIKEDGPLVRVLCHALHAIDGAEHSAGKVASGLRRRLR